MRFCPKEHSKCNCSERYRFEIHAIADKPDDNDLSYQFALKLENSKVYAFKCNFTNSFHIGTLLADITDEFIIVKRHNLLTLLRFAVGSSNHKFTDKWQLEFRFKFCLPQITFKIKLFSLARCSLLNSYLKRDTITS